jgi:hypothetical protein
MNRLPSFLSLLATLALGPFALAQNVYVNLVPTRPGDHNVPAGSLVHVSNTTGGDVTVQVPDQPPVTVAPGGTHTFTVPWSPGGSTHIDGPSGRWRLNPMGTVEPIPIG